MGAQAWRHEFAGRAESMSHVADTTPEMEKLVADRYRAMTPTERVLIAASMYETARAIVASSLPPNLTREDRRLAIVRRIYGKELPEAALLAHARHPVD
jgi:hypothetical protein